MTTVAQLIAKLQFLPQDAEIECGKEGRCAYESCMVYAPIDLDDFTICDYTSEADKAKYPHMAGKVIVHINAE